MTDLARRIAALADDHVSSASALLPAAVDILRDARQAGDLTRAARGLCAAQPAMAAIWNAAGAALAADPSALDRLAERAQRAPAAIARLAHELALETQAPQRRSFVAVTCSASLPVERFLHLAARHLEITVRCGEGRPALEGCALATRLADAGVSVELFTDAGLSQAIDGADLIVVGADAIAPDWFINKVGTRALAAVAAATGVQVQVLAGREKFVTQPLAERLSLRDGPPDGVGGPDHPRIRPRNPYFERIPMGLVAAVVTDIGIIGGGEVAALCSAVSELCGTDRLLAILD